jgi:hypothetical protein
MKKTEEKIQTAISKYLKLQYPNVYFTAESSGLRVTMGTAIKMKSQRSVHKQLDIIILEPKGTYCGLILELKKDRKEVFLKSGAIKSSEHIKEQINTIALLRYKGYYSRFAFGFEDAKNIIDKYMAL